MGYNCPVEQNVLDGRWHLKPEDTRRSGSASTRSRRSTDGARQRVPARGAARLRQGRQQAAATRRPACATTSSRSTPDNPDLFLGKAYYAVGPLRVHSNFFILERHRVGLTDYVRR